MEPPASIRRGQVSISMSLKNANGQALETYRNCSLKNRGAQGRHFLEEIPMGVKIISSKIRKSLRKEFAT